jgi:hypothetical protein
MNKAISCIFPILMVAGLATSDAKEVTISRRDAAFHIMIEKLLQKQILKGYHGEYGLALTERRNALKIAMLYFDTMIGKDYMKEHTDIEIMEHKTFWFVYAKLPCPKGSVCLGEFPAVALRKIDGKILFIEKAF